MGPPGGSRKRAAGLSLDLNSASAKRNKQVQSLLTSPDVQMLKLTSPELEEFLIQVPDGVKIKDEPDDHLSLSGSDYGSEGMKSPLMNTTGMSPIDMESQEKIKLDRKRQRNRLAASKCRKRKLERISQLDDRVAGLKNENADLAAVVKKMQPPPGGSRKRAAGLSLDLNSASAKRNKQVQSLLTSPDVQMLKLTSPELEKFLIQNPTLATPTPSGYIFPKSVTEEQAMYAKGFEEALEHLRQSEPPGSNDLAAANTLATLSTASVAVTSNSQPPPAEDA